MNNVIHCCRLSDLSDGPDILPEFLSALELEFSSWADRETGRSWHTVYCTSAVHSAEVKKRLEASRGDWRDSGAVIGDIELFTIKKEDWSEAWKKHFHILHISPRLVIKPSWLEYRPEPGQVIVEIDPGMSFGTGQHATTAYCLKMIDGLTGTGAGAFLDAGCGSGILSIAAVKLGFRPVAAFDIDPDAIRVAAENFAHNGIPPDDCELTVSGLAEFPAGRTFDLIAANILSGILLENRDKIASLLRPGGKLILAGILREEFAAIRVAFEKTGFTMFDSHSEKEWTGGAFRKL